MRILFVVDGRSPIALNWIRYFVEHGDEVHAASTFNCNIPFNLASQTFIPVAFSGVKPANSRNNGMNDMKFYRAPNSLKVLLFLRHWLGPVTIPKASERLKSLINKIKPDVVHAMRIPFEGMVAARACGSIPLVVSVWGNDFTLHAPSAPGMAASTRFTLQNITGLHTDCQRDIKTAYDWGFTKAQPYTVLPGNGGVKTDIFSCPQDDQDPRIPSMYRGVVAEPIFPSPPSFTAINPRGIRVYVKNDVFFKAIPIVLKDLPEAFFICPGMDGNQHVERWLGEYGISASVALLPKQSPVEMAQLYKTSRVSVSPSTHDGTPNTLLESMSSGCVPIAGELESIREWITPGQNGMLINPHDPYDIAQAILFAFKNDDLFRRAKKINTKIISERAEYYKSMITARRFYKEILTI